MAFSADGLGRRTELTGSVSTEEDTWYPTLATIRSGQGRWRGSYASSSVPGKEPRRGELVDLQRWRGRGRVKMGREGEGERGSKGFEFLRRG